MSMMNTASTVTVKGTRVEIDGTIRSGERELDAIQNVLKNETEKVQSIRFFNVDFSELDEDFTKSLEELLTSRGWDRCIMAYCSGIMSETSIRGILQTNKLELYGPQINVVKALGGALGNDSSPIAHLRLRTRFNNQSIVALAEGLKTNTSLTELFLTCQFMDSESMLSLASGLEENQHLELLSLYSCELFDEPSMENFIRSLQSHPTLATLELRDNNCFGMPALSSLVRNTKHLRNLFLFHPPHSVNQLQVPRLNAESFAIALQENKSLKTVNLSSNGLHAGSAIWLAMALRINTTLESMNLQGNLITDKGVEALAEALPEMKSLKNLYLWNNPFSGIGARALVQGLKSNLVLEEITTFSRFRCSGELHYYTHLNKAGHRILKNLDGVPLSLWPVILGRVNEQRWESGEKASILYALLREGPVAFL